MSFLKVGAAMLVAGTISCSKPATHANVSMFSKADAYERFMGRWSRLLAPRLIAFSQVHDGDAVLDVGTGTGELAVAVRDSTKAVRIVGIDPSPDYVGQARARGSDSRVSFQIGDAQSLQFTDASFDQTLSLLVINFIPDRPRALREMIRVTKPGGAISAVVWDYGEGMEMLRAFWDEAIAFDPAIEPRDEAHMPLCKRGELGAMWREAGLEDVQEDSFTITLQFASWDDYWAPFRLGQGPAGAYVASLPKDRQAELEARLRRRILPTGPDRPFEMRARAWAVRGKRPKS